MARAALCRLLTFATLVSTAWCKCQYSRWPDAPSSKHLHRVCLTAEFKDFRSKFFSRGRRCEVEVKLPPGKKLTVDTCEATCNENSNCKGFVIRSPWSEKRKRGNCWLIYKKSLTRYSRQFEIGKDRKKRTFLKEFCKCEARYVHVQRQSRVGVNRVEGVIQALGTDLSKTNKSIADLNAALVEKMDKRNKLVARGGSGYWNLFGDSVESLDAAIEKLESDLESAERVYSAVEADISAKQSDLEAEKSKLSPLAELESIDGIYQWFPMQAEHQSKLELHKIKVSNIFLSEDKQSVLYRCTKKTAHRSPADWHVANLRQILAAFKIKSLSDFGSLSTLKILKIYFNSECLGFRLRNTAGGSSSMCSRGKCLPVPTLSLNDPDAGCHETATEANARREELVIAHMVDDTEPADGDKAQEEAEAMKGCPLARDEVSVKLMEWTAWAEANPGLVTAALKAMQVASYFTSSVEWSAGAESAYMAQRLKVILKNFVPVLAALRSIDSTEDMWVKISCSAVMLKGIQNMQGIFPKLAQNLAMRPDLVQDEYARNKLKETQSENPERERADVEKFVRGKQAKVLLAGPGSAAKEVPLFDVIEYSKLLAAGSVGQVLLYKVTSEALARKLRADGVRDDLVILKVVFEETEHNYKSDWTLLEVFFSLASSFGDLGPILTLWDFLRPMKESIFNEFDLKVEGKNTAEGREMLHEFTRLVKGKEVEGLSGVKFTAPVTLTTTSKYALIQSLATGTELKNYLIEAVGLPGALSTWRHTIYRGILHVYGFMAMGKGFFQADPHNGNWFVDDMSEKDIVVTLIDWGGVERFAPGDHCRLAEFYYKARAETQRYDRCSTVQISTGHNLEFLGGAVAGHYAPAGVSIFGADDEKGLPDLLLGFSAAYKYKKVGPDGTERVLHFDGELWHLSELCTGRDCDDLFQDILTYKSEQELEGNPRDPLSASQRRPKLPNAGRWVTGAAGGSHQATGSVYIQRRQDPTCKEYDNLADDKRNVARAVQVFKGLARSLGLDPAPERTIPDSALAVGAEAFDSDAALLARIGLDVYKTVQDAQLNKQPAPDVIPRIAPEWVLLVRCLAVFQGMLFDVLSQNIPPKLPKEYLEWFLDPSADKLFKYWAGYAERANVLDGRGKCVRGEAALVQVNSTAAGSPPEARDVGVHRTSSDPAPAKVPTGPALGPGAASHLMRRMSQIDVDVARH